MTSSVSNNDYPSWFSENSGIPGLDAIFYRYPLSNPSSSPEEVVFQGEQPFSSCSNWPWEHDPYFGGCWGDSFLCSEFITDDNRHEGSVGKTCDAHHSEQQYNSYFGCYEDMYNQTDFDFSSWCGYEYGEEEDDSYDYGDNELEAAYRYNLDEVRLCEGIFGYFPCLIQDQRAYAKE